MTGSEAVVRPMESRDLDAIFQIDQEIRGSEEVVTYADVTTQQIFAAERRIVHPTTPIAYRDLIIGDVSRLLDWGFVAEVGNQVRGFVLGRVCYAGDAALTEVGQVLIIGVHPDQRGMGIAVKLVGAICDKFRSQGIKTVHAEIDQRDKPLLGLAKRVGFRMGHRVDYTLAL